MFTNLILKNQRPNSRLNLNYYKISNKITFVTVFNVTKVEFKNAKQTLN